MIFQDDNKFIFRLWKFRSNITLLNENPYTKNICKYKCELISQKDKQN